MPSPSSIAESSALKGVGVGVDADVDVEGLMGGRGVCTHAMSTLPTEGSSPPGRPYMNFSAVKRSLNVIEVLEGVMSRSVYSPMPW